MKVLLNLFIVFFCVLSCRNPNTNLVKTASEDTAIICDTKGCKGTYIGAEFINGADVAHQHSNKMSKIVGDKLKEFYSKGQYKRVDFDKIEMTTDGMGSGKVSYMLFIPFVSVRKKCDAYTSFDHVGGWNHEPALQSRKKQLSPLLMVGHQLYISDLKITDEGLQEYWIQWKNKDQQADCD